jgi:hypothetical protein
MAGLPLQALVLSRTYPDADLSLSPTKLIWRGRITPSELSDTYTIEIAADNRGNMPGVRVTAPQLEPDSQGRLPHVWPDGSLCLNRRGRWSRRYLLAHTIIPWTSEWLLHYELWKGAGVWLGDGTEGEMPASQASLLHDYPYPS